MPAVGKALGAEVATTNGIFEIRKGKTVFSMEGASIAWFRTLVLRKCTFHLVDQEAPVTATEIRLRFPLSSLMKGSPRPDCVRIIKGTLNVTETNGVSNISPLAEALKAEMIADGRSMPDLALKLCKIEDCSIHIERHYLDSRGYPSYNSIGTTVSSTLKDFTLRSFLDSLKNGYANFLGGAQTVLPVPAVKNH